METNFHNDDFERLLREKSNEFRMYPSKRIWYSIYNNIHPGRKWPSIAMSITLITSLLLIGYLNTKNTNSYTRSGLSVTNDQKTIAQSITPLPYSQIFSESVAINLNKSSDPFANYKTGIIPGNQLSNKTGLNSSLVAELPTIERVNTDVPGVGANQQDFTLPLKKEVINEYLHGFNLITGSSEPIAVRDENKFNSDADQPGILTYDQKTALPIFMEYQRTNEVAFSDQDISKSKKIAIPDLNAIVEKNNPALNFKNGISTEDKDWIDNYALYNRPAAKKWANKLAGQFYVTPSIVYRKLYNDLNFGSNLNTTPIVNPSSTLDINNAVYHTPSLGFEMGIGLLYSISKGVKLKAGLQLNYTRYNSSAYHNTHPVATKLTMHNFATNTSYEVQRTTPYSNKSGLETIKLHNETFQVSLPIGADLKLLGNENLQWNVGATIQPTYIIGGRSYLISSDRRNYVKESSMLAKWNLNAGFETFISYKSNGITWQIGPQFRTQLYSTNNKRFAVEEKLVNYGIKFGISKTIK